MNSFQWLYLLLTSLTLATSQPEEQLETLEEVPRPEFDEWDVLCFRNCNEQDHECELLNACTPHPLYDRLQVWQVSGWVGLFCGFLAMALSGAALGNLRGCGEACEHEDVLSAQTLTTVATVTETLALFSQTANTYAHFNHVRPVSKFVIAFAVYLLLKTGLLGTAFAQLAAFNPPGIMAATGIALAISLFETLAAVKITGVWEVFLCMAVCIGSIPRLFA